MRKRTPYFYLILLFLLGSLSACSHSTGKEKANKKSEYARNELATQHGLALFNQHCASCHSFSENGIGPNLAGVTSAVDKEWLVTFIHNPSAVIESGDERATQLFATYKQYMPAFPMIAGEDMEDLLGFIHKFSDGGKRNRTNRPGGILNPVPDKIPQSSLSLVVEEWLTVPATADASPKARINKLLAIEGDRLFIHDLRGKLYEIKNRSAEIYLDVVSELPDFIDNPGFGTGLGSFAFHPDFSRNGLFYTTHTEPSRTQVADFTFDDSIRSSLQWVLTAWKAADPSATQFSGSHRELLRAEMVTGAHGFQELTFNPLAKAGEADYGMLYLGIGDGGAALRGYTFLCDHPGNIWSSIIRIDPTGKNSSNGKYGIPADNPFVRDATALGEVWASGFRNPHRISWDETGSGKMLISTIGQHSVEEVNLGKAGAHYGWPYREGTFLFDADASPEMVYPLPSDDTGFTYPVAQYDHDEGNAISGGFVYAGAAIPELKGKYIFGDIPRGTLFYAEVAAMQEGQQSSVYRLQLEMNEAITDLETLTQSKRVDLRLGMDGAGELYLFSKSNGVVYKIVGCKADAVSL